MKNLLFTCVLLFLFSSLSAQNRDTWVGFLSEDTLLGFRNSAGLEMIEPKLDPYTQARKFDDIIEAAGAVENKFHWFYLTKSGRVVGRDSAYFFDATPDCENEGFIRFTDRQKDRSGLFNKNGDIVIPAEYNDLTSVANGMLVALKGAKKEDDGEHFSYVGGTTVLLDTTNRILIDGFESEGNLNFYSLIKSPKPSSDSIRRSFLATDGQYYSFVDFDREFEMWVKKTLVPDFSEMKLLEEAFPNITFWDETKGWIREGKEVFIARNFQAIKSKLLELTRPGSDYSLVRESLNPLIYEGHEFETFFDNCGQAKDWSHPGYEIIINHSNNGDLTQDHFGFLRTDQGYKLIRVDIK